MTMQDSQRQAVKSANRVLDLFELLGSWKNEMSHTQIAAALDIPKSSLSQLLPNLVERGYIQYAPENKGYRLGPKLVELASDVSAERNLDRIIIPILENITLRTGESSAFNVLQGTESVVSVSISSPQRLVSHMRSGDLAPLYATSGGKVLLAFMPDASFEDYLTKVEFAEVTKNTIGSVDELRKQIGTVRREGLAYSLEEFTPGIIGMAVPLMLANAKLLGAINVAMPAVRYNTKVRDNVADVLVDAANTVRQRLGGGFKG